MQLHITRDDWQLLDSIFASSPARLEELLSPDRTSGLLSDDDYQHLQREMFWINRTFRRYRTPLSVFLGANLGYFVHAQRNTRFRTIPPRWRWVPGVVTGTFGFALGEFDAYATNLTFERMLKNPQAMQQTIRNIRTRLAHVEHIQEAAEEVWHNHDDFTEVRDRTVSSSPSRILVNTDEPDSIHVHSSHPQPQARPQQAPLSRSRWDEIRAKNARSATRTSSWDILRENHERERMVVGRSEDPDSSSTIPPSRDSDRASEQAKFDALLELERRRASS